MIPTRRAVALILGGLIGLCVGGELIVKSAVDIAMRMGVSEAIIGLTIVALGTSLPELATSIIAATKHNSDIAAIACNFQRGIRQFGDPGPFARFPDNVAITGKIP